jgi:hypothetical protein
MKTATRFLLLASISLLVACGGGGSDNGIDPALRQAAQEALEDCAVDNIEEFLKLLELFAGIFVPGGSAEDFLVETADPGAAKVEWRVDTDGDQIPDVAGSLEFVDANGDPLPELPFNIEELLDGLDNLLQYLPQLPPGTHIRIFFGSESGLPRVGRLVIALTGGSIEGDGGVGEEGCSLEFEFSNVTVDLQGSGFPVGTVDFDLDPGSDPFEGQIRMNGTSTARILITDSENNTFEFLLNLVTFQISDPT